MFVIGTFARVWLARLSDRGEDPNQIYALKILRKADGEYPFYPLSSQLGGSALFEANNLLLFVSDQTEAS